jgi:Cupin domain
MEILYKAKHLFLQLLFVITFMPRSTRPYIPNVLLKRKPSPRDTIMKPSYTSVIRTTCLCLTTLLLFITPAYSADYNTGVTTRVLIKTSVTGNGQQITYPVTDKAEVTAMTVELAPGAETGWHKHPVPVYAYVISGTLSVEIEGGKQLTFNA